MKTLMGRVVRTIRCQWKHFIWNFSKKINANLFDYVRFEMATGRKLNYRDPKWLNDKLMWLNRYWIPAIKVRCADKIAMREYVIGLDFPDLHTPSLYGVWERAEDIDFDKLPSQFVLKCNHGCGYNIVVKDKNALNSRSVIVKLNAWLKEDYGRQWNEHHYSYIKRKIFAEEYMSDLDATGNIIDYKLMCVGGEPAFFLLCRERDTQGRALLSSYTLDWQRANYLKHEDPTDVPPPPVIWRL